MSIYSGFATRQQQQSYDQCLQTVIYIMQKRILRFYNNQSTDQDKFINILNKMYKQMKNTEQHKYLQPKSSKTFQQLIVYLKNKKLQQVSIVQNRPTQTYCIQYIQQQQLNKRQPQTHTEMTTNNLNNINNNDRSQKLQVIYNKPKQIQDFPVRPNTMNNRIRKRVSSNSRQGHYYTKFQKSSMSNTNNVCNANNISDNTDRNTTQNYNIKKQYIFNQPASKLANASRNQPRNQSNNTTNQLKNTKQVSKQRNKRKSLQQNIQQSYTHTDNGRQANVQQLIKSYINKTKKSYIKGINRKKDQIDQLLRLA